MKRRTFLGAALASTSPLFAAVVGERWEDAAEVLAQATRTMQVDAAVLHVAQRGESFTRHFGRASSGDAMFLLGSISKPICMTAVMTLFDGGRFQLDDRVRRFLPAFTGDGRDDVTIRHLLTHVSGLPDQVANNAELRRRHAPLTEFAAQAMRTPLRFAPGARYQYSSMGILLAARIGELISGTDILTLVDRAVFRPLGMQRLGPGARTVSTGGHGLLPGGGRCSRIGGRRSTSQGMGLEQSLLAKVGRPLGRDARFRAERGHVPRRVLGGTRPGREARDGPADGQEPQSEGTHAARLGVQCRHGGRQSGMFRANVRSCRLNRHALLGRPSERHHLRRPHVAAAPCGPAPSVRTRGGTRRRVRPTRGKQSMKMTCASGLLALKGRPDFLYGFFLGIADRAGFAFGVGKVGTKGFIGTGDHPDSRHLEVAIRVGLLDPIVGIDEPLVSVLPPVAARTTRSHPSPSRTSIWGRRHWGSAPGQNCRIQPGKANYHISSRWAKCSLCFF